MQLFPFMAGDEDGDAAGEDGGLGRGGARGGGRARRRSGAGASGALGGFVSPSPNSSHAAYLAAIGDNAALRADTPLAFGLHPNAEIGFRTAQAEQLFASLVQLQPADAAAGSGEAAGRGGGGGGGSGGLGEEEGGLARYLAELREQFGDKRFDLEDLRRSAEESTAAAAAAASVAPRAGAQTTAGGGGGVGGCGGGVDPFLVVFLQEANTVDGVLGVLLASLASLSLGLAGELTMSAPMDELAAALAARTVPRAWAAVAWPSQRALPSWCADLAMRAVQLEAWTQTLALPQVTWLPGLANPQSFLTAVCQVRVLFRSLARSPPARSRN